MKAPAKMISTLCLSGFTLALILFAAPAALAQSPWWHLTSNVKPAILQPGGSGVLVVQALNVGDGPTDGSITVTAKLPEGLSAQKVEVNPGEPEPKVSFFAFAATPGLGPHEEQRFHGEGLGPEEGRGGLHACREPSTREIQCTYEGFFSPVTPYEFLELGIAVTAESGSGFTGETMAEVSGGEAPPAQIQRRLVVAAETPAFGVEEFSFISEEEGGGIAAQAGSHPYQLTTSLALEQTSDPLVPPALPKDLQFKLPTGLVGNATALPQCDDADFRILRGGIADLCPQDTAIGVATLTLDEPVFGGVQTISVPLFNLTPSAGEPARFGFEYVGSPVTIDTHVRTGEDYGVIASVSNITELTNFISESVTFWGVPGDPVHDSSRGWGCVAGEHWAAEAHLTCVAANESHPSPFLTLPTSCAAPFVTTLEGDSWPSKANGSGEPRSIALPRRQASLTDEIGRRLGITGCDQVPFAASIDVAPEFQEASTPSGVSVDVHIPQEAGENATGRSSSSVKSITVALPEGVTLNPAGAGGLQACPEAGVGFTGFGEFDPSAEPGVKTAAFSPTLPDPFCPTASKVATVKIKTPLLANPIEGAVYLAAQEANPFGSLVAMYIVAEDPISGTLVKLAGNVSLNPQSGQIISTFENLPQLPFEDAVFQFFGGPRAPLATPDRCGTFTTNASLVPWSGREAVSPSSHFEITSGPKGAPCPSPKPFAPSLEAGTTNINAAAFSPLVTTIGREDGNQEIETVQLKTPPGLLGSLSGVTLCPEAQANAGSCGPESLIGHTTVKAGLGGEPITVTGGEVFLTEKYDGAPFGLSIVTPAVAGPYNLGKVIVRAKVEIDPHTTALTITTGAIPHILDGIPLQLKRVSVTIDRAGFTLNPTSCNATAIVGTVGSAEGSSAPVSSSFQLANCSSLKFAPKFTVSTNGKTSKAGGASLTTRLAYPTAPQGTQANIARVKVDLPKQLPSRLTTLQKACTAAQFEANPAGCPAASIVGHATVHTPLLPVPLTGPAYFVSHGGEAFPSLTMILQGYGVTVDLAGATLIKAGITSTTFKSVPDVPFSTFELTLPQGKFSALAANGNLCTSKLAMPTEFVAQNGMIIHQSTPIKTTGCAKSLTKAQKLARALKACAKKGSKAARSGCERQARKRYGVAKKRKHKA